MIHLPSTPKTFIELLGLSIRHHFAVVRKIVVLILLLVVVKDACIYLGGMPTNAYLYGFVSVIMTVFILYLLTAILYATHCVLYNENISWRSALKDTLTRMGRVILAFAAFIVVPALLFFIGELIARWMMLDDVHPPRYSGLILVLVVGIPVMIVYLYYLFTIPLIVTENYAVWPAFKRAPMIVGKAWENLVRVFGIYVCALAIWLLVSPDTLHGHLMKMYKISAIFDFIAFVVTLPIVMNLIIFMRNDLKLRKEICDTDTK